MIVLNRLSLRYDKCEETTIVNMIGGCWICADDPPECQIADVVVTTGSLRDEFIWRKLPDEYDFFRLGQEKIIQIHSRSTLSTPVIRKTCSPLDVGGGRPPFGLFPSLVVPLYLHVDPFVLVHTALQPTLRRLVLVQTCTYPLSVVWFWSSPLSVVWFGFGPALRAIAFVGGILFPQTSTILPGRGTRP